MTTRALAALILGTLAVSGCGDSTKTPSAATTTATEPTVTTSNEVAVLTRAVRKAVTENHEVSGKVLWTNRVPRHVRSTAGPALRELRRSAADRRKQGIRVRTVSDRFSIRDVRLDPSFTRAAATVINTARVKPHRIKTGRSGKSIVLHETARLELRRVGSTARFVVWRVTVKR